MHQTKQFIFPFFALLSILLASRTLLRFLSAADNNNDNSKMWMDINNAPRQNRFILPCRYAFHVQNKKMCFTAGLTTFYGRMCSKQKSGYFQPAVGGCGVCALLKCCEMKKTVNPICYTSLSPLALHGAERGRHDVVETRPVLYLEMPLWLCTALQIEKGIRFGGKDKKKIKIDVT